MSIEIHKFIRSRRRTISLIVERDGTLTVRAPQQAALKDVEAFIQRKAAWILRTREKLTSRPAYPGKEFIDGEKFLLYGREHELKIVRAQRPALQFEQDFTLGSTARPRARRTFERWYREQALLHLTGRVAWFANQHGFQPGRVKINSARTRWGSCSPDGTLNFTWRLVMAPLDVIDYVVLHELAHLRVRSHSRKFWSLVETLCPDHRIHRKWLRENGERLTL